MKIQIQKFNRFGNTESNLNKKLFNEVSDTLGLANTYFRFQYKSENINESALQAVDVDDILKRMKQKYMLLDSVVYKKKEKYKQYIEEDT